MKSIEQRLKDEQNFHDEIFESGARESVGKFYAINEIIENDYYAKVFQHIDGDNILEYGCGMGDKLFQLSEKGAKCYGIDISEYAIKTLSEKAIERGLEINYQVMNAEDLQFETGHFDLVYGSGILHHLDLKKSFSTIANVLDENGSALFIEPLGHNFLINRFRNKTPALRTEDEHPLMMEDLKMAKRYFHVVKVKHYFLSTLALPLLFKKPPKFLISITNTFDRFLFLFPFIRKQSWQVIMELKKPKRN